MAVAVSGGGNNNNRSNEHHHCSWIECGTVVVGRLLVWKPNNNRNVRGQAFMYHSFIALMNWMASAWQLTSPPKIVDSKAHALKYNHNNSVQWICFHDIIIIISTLLYHMKLLNLIVDSFARLLLLFVSFSISYYFVVAIFERFDFGRCCAVAENCAVLSEFIHISSVSAPTE